MIWTSLNDAKIALDLAVCDRLCVQTWLGVGNVLFIGFGESVLTHTPGSLHAMPEYELETGFTDWWVEDEFRTLGKSTDRLEDAEKTASLLVGHRAESWRFIGDSPAIEICFEGRLWFRMSPYAGYGESHEDAWILRLPGEYYGIMMWDRSVDTGRRDD